MKLLTQALLLSTLITSTFCISYVKAEEEKDGNFDERKAKALENINARIDGLTSLKSCVSAASKKSDLKKCRKNHKAKMEPMRKQMKEQRAKMKARRKAKKGSE